MNIRHLTSAILALWVFLLVSTLSAIEIGDRVEAGIEHNMRASHGTSYDISGTAWPGIVGTVVGGPVDEDGFTWWQISWDQNPTAWSAEGNSRIRVLEPDAPDPPAPPSLKGPGSSESPGPILDDLTPRFSWEEVDGADTYVLYFRKDGDELQSPGYEDGTSWTMPEGVLEPGSEYRWNMVAINDGGESEVSETYYFRTPVASEDPPGSPSLVGPGSSESPGPILENLTPEFSWEEVDGADRYNVFFRKVGDDVQSSGFENGTSWTMPEGVLEPGSQYRWNMTATNDGGEGAVSETFYFRTPVASDPLDAPSNLEASVANGNAILTWNDNSDNESGFEIERRVGGIVWLLIETTSDNVSTFTDHNPPSGSLEYRVRAYNDLENSDYSNTVGATLSIAIQVTEVRPNPLPATTDYRWIRVEGSGFAEGLQVNLTSPNGSYELAAKDIDIRSTTELRIRVRSGTHYGNWTLAVHINGSVSNEYSFSVTEPTIPRPEPEMPETRIEVYEELPIVKTPGAVGLICLIHGIEERPEHWPVQMAQKISNYLTEVNKGEAWDVIYIDWTEQAKAGDFPWSTGIVSDTLRERVRVNAKNLGATYGERIKQLDYEKIHFISTSCGVWLAEYAAKAIDNPSKIQTTFLDAYTPSPYFRSPTLVGQVAYGTEPALGDNSAIAEHYFTTGSRISLLGLLRTDSILGSASNYNVDDLYEGFQNPIGGHRWPRVWYDQTISDGSTFGFALSPAIGGKVMVEKGKCIRLPSEEEWTPSIWDDILHIVSPFIISEGDSAYVGSGFGNVTTPSTIELESSSPAWITIDKTVDGPRNFLSFDLEFDDFTDSDAILSVYWSNVLLATYQPEILSSSYTEQSILLPLLLPMESCSFSFRLDSKDGETSLARVSNLELNYFGPPVAPNDLRVSRIKDKLDLKFSGYSVFDYVVQSSNDLNEWTDIATLSKSSASGVSNYTYNLPVATSDHQFRIKAIGQVE